MEFQEVCKHMARMCEKYRGSYGCPNCPMVNLKPRVCDDMPVRWDSLLLNRTEQIVTEWAKEHPEPVYETWYDYLDEIGLFENCRETPRLIVAQILNKQHIPPDIGKKLGLKPVKWE